MKKFALLTLLGLSLAACTQTVDPDVNKPVGPSDGSGALRIGIASESDITVVETRSNENANINDFSIDIIDAGGMSYAKYASYSQVPAEVALPAGHYSIAATSGKMKSAAFDEPHFSGLKAFDVEVGKTAEVTVSCVITNVKVTIGYSAKILETLTDIKASVTSAYDGSDETKVGRLNFTPTETRAGWFAKPANKEITVYVTGKNKVNGSVVTQTATLSKVEARQWRKVTLDIKTSGGVDVEISVDGTVVEAPNVDITLPDSDDVIDNNGDEGNWEEKPEPDQPEPPLSNKPIITGSAFGTIGANVPFDIDKEVIFKVEADEVLDVLLASQVETGITNLFLTIESEALKEVLSGLLGITGEIDLANPDVSSVWYEMFCSTELGILDPAVPIKGKKSHTFSVGGMMGLLGGLPGATDSPHKFHIRLVDANGETAKTLTIKLVVVETK